MAKLRSESNAKVASRSDLGNIWSTFKEIDIRPIREEAEHPLAIAVVGAKGVGKSALVHALKHNARPREHLVLPVVEIQLENAAEADSGDLVVLMLDANQNDFSAEAEVYTTIKNARRNVIVYFNKIDLIVSLPSESPAARAGSSIAALTAGNGASPWSAGRIAFGSAIDPESLATQFVPNVLDALPNQRLALARRFPLFRFAVARALIADTSIANATYSFSTGIAEAIPALDIPFNVADIVIITKNQALMVYKLGLALGLSPRWQDQLAQLGGVIGAGFLWRQVARELVGLIPVWGILPKVAIAYAGTFAVGEAILVWYKTGHKISGSEMRKVYSDALARGREMAQNLLSRAPRPAFPKMHMPSLPRGRAKKICASCGKENAGDSKYCKNCGVALQ